MHSLDPDFSFESVPDIVALPEIRLSVSFPFMPSPLLPLSPLSLSCRGYFNQVFCCPVDLQLFFLP